MGALTGELETARWEYNYIPDLGNREAELVGPCKTSESVGDKNVNLHKKAVNTHYR